MVLAESSNTVASSGGSCSSARSASRSSKLSGHITSAIPRSPFAHMSDSVSECPAVNRKSSPVGTGIIANALAPRLLVRALWAARRGGRWWRGRSGSRWLLHSLKGRIFDKGRIARGDEFHPIPGLQQQVQLRHLLSERDKHRPLGRRHLHKEPIPLTLLAHDCAFDPFALPADRLGQVGGHKRRPLRHSPHPEDNPNRERTAEDQPSFHAASPSEGDDQPQSQPGSCGPGTGCLRASAFHVWPTPWGPRPPSTPASRPCSP